MALAKQTRPQAGLTFRLVLFLLLALLPALAHAQREREQALSDAEVETLRETAYEPQDRVMSFIAFLNQRTAGMDKLIAGRRQPGREEDLHDLMEQTTSILDDLNDNLDDYNKRHKDIRKALPKLLAATEKWATSVKTPAPDSHYDVARKLALEALTDVRAEAAKMVEEQKAWFKEHPPTRDDRGGRG